MDTKNEPAMTVHKENGDELKIIETKGGLYYYEIKPKTGIKKYSRWLFFHVHKNWKKIAQIKMDRTTHNRGSH